MDCPKKRGGAVAGIPEDALVEILSRLPVKSLHRCKCVARAWRDLIDDPLLRKVLPQTMEGLLFMDNEIYHGCDGRCFSFVNMLPRSVPLEIDLSFSFLTKLPEIEVLSLMDSCNGLLLFQHSRHGEPLEQLGYIVCNPATEHWVAVPTCGSLPPEEYCCDTHLVFNPAVSSFFHLVQFWIIDPLEDTQDREDDAVTTVHAYSSETRTWSRNKEKGKLERWRYMDQIAIRDPSLAVVNGMLHYVIIDSNKEVQIAAIDVRGKTQRIIPVPLMADGEHGYVAESQGRLHYMKSKSVSKLFIWVLKDYDTKEWTVKHKVTFLELFGRLTDYIVVGMHPDRNLIFVIDLQKLKLISYDMDHNLVSVLTTLEESWDVHVALYVPYFSESLVLTNKH